MLLLLLPVFRGRFSEAASVWSKSLVGKLGVLASRSTAVAQRFQALGTVHASMGKGATKPLINRLLQLYVHNL